MNYRQEWVEGDIEASTLLDAIEKLEEKNNQLKAALSMTIKAIEWWQDEHSCCWGESDEELKAARTLLGIQENSNV